MINWNSTEQFDILRGLPEGDTASHYLFILVLEIRILRELVKPYSPMGAFFLSQTALTDALYFIVYVQYGDWK